MHKTPTTFPALALGTALALVAALALAGCGGGGSGSGNRTLNGTLLDADSAPLAGDTVVYDKGMSSQRATVTDAQGRYRIVIDRDAITGSDTLSFYDAAGHAIDIVPVTIHTDAPSTTLTTVAPPQPPSQQL